MTTSKTALWPWESSALCGNFLAAKSSSRSCDLGTRIHSVPRSIRRHGLQGARSSSNSSSASAAVTLARDVEMPRFLNRSTSSEIVQRRDSAPARQAMTAALNSTLSASFSMACSKGSWAAGSGWRASDIRSVLTPWGKKPKVPIIPIMGSVWLAMQCAPLDPRGRLKAPLRPGAGGPFERTNLVGVRSRKGKNRTPGSKFRGASYHGISECAANETGKREYLQLAYQARSLYSLALAHPFFSGVPRVRPPRFLFLLLRGCAFSQLLIHNFRLYLKSR